MTASIAEALAQLGRDWPEWEFWHVPCAVDPDKWCARRHDDHKHVLNAYGPAQLAEEVARAQARL